MSGFLSRTALALVAAVAVAMAVAVVAVASAEPAEGQVDPDAFACDGGLYITTGTPDDMQLTRVDQTTGALTDIGPGGLVANALAYDPDDDHLYGIDRDAPHEVVRLDDDGTETSLGVA